MEFILGLVVEAQKTTVARIRLRQEREGRCRIGAPEVLGGNPQATNTEWQTKTDIVLHGDTRKMESVSPEWKSSLHRQMAVPTESMIRYGFMKLIKHQLSTKRFGVRTYRYLLLFCFHAKPMVRTLVRRLIYYS